MTRIEKSVEVNVPLHTAYNQLTQFEEFPRFMEGVQEIRQLDDTHLHWHARSDGQEREWDCEIIEQIPDKIIAWRNTSGDINTGRVEFQPMAEDKTKVTLIMDCESKGEASKAQVQEAQRTIAQRTEQDLVRFKKMIESQGVESGAWRGEVHNAQAIRQDDQPQESKPVVQPATLRQQPQQGAQPATAQQSGTQQQSGQAESSWLPKISEVWEEPFVVMRKMTQEMDNFFERFIGRPLGMPAWAQGGAKNWAPPVEVARRDNQLIISADLPGIKREDVNVEIRNDRLTIEGERHAQAQRPEQEYRRTERPYGHFYREIPLPEGVDPDAAAASMHDGVLEITLPIVPSNQRGRRLDIRSPH